MDRAVEYRRRADDARECARTARTIDTEEAFVAIAAQWDALAKESERLARIAAVVQSP